MVGGRIESAQSGRAARLESAHENGQRERSVGGDQLMESIENFNASRLREGETRCDFNAFEVWDLETPMKYYI